MNLFYSYKTSLRVRYGETDQMGYCYYGNYAQYFEVGRVEAMRNAGMSYRDLEEKGVMLPVKNFVVEYFVPAKYDDELVITTFITSVKGAKLLFDYEIHNEEGVLLVKAHTTLVFVSKSNMRPIKAPDEFVQLLEKYKI